MFYFILLLRVLNSPWSCWVLQQPLCIWDLGLWAASVFDYRLGIKNPDSLERQPIEQEWDKTDSRFAVCLWEPSEPWSTKCHVFTPPQACQPSRWGFKGSLLLFYIVLYYTILLPIVLYYTILLPIILCYTIYYLLYYIPRSPKP